MFTVHMIKSIQARLCRRLRLPPDRSLLLFLLLPLVTLFLLVKHPAEASPLIVEPPKLGVKESAEILPSPEPLIINSSNNINASSSSQHLGNSSHGHQTLASRTAAVYGIRIEESRRNFQDDDDGIFWVLANDPITIQLFGDRFTPQTIVRFVTERSSQGSDCDDFASTRSFTLQNSKTEENENFKSEDTHTVWVHINLPPLQEEEDSFYICVRENDTDMPWVHQGTESWVRLKSYETLLPLWTHILLLTVLLLLSGLFSGLNLGLMSLDRTELDILRKTGTVEERRHAKTIGPLRNKGNFLLCSLLLGNVLVNSTLTILLDDLTTGLVAVLAATLGIVVFGEILPQAFCSRYGLAVGAQTIWLTKALMVITCPLSYPISLLLDKLLGEEIANIYTRDRLRELIKVAHLQHNHKHHMDKEFIHELQIMAGALEMRLKTVKTVMTPLDEIFMLPISTILDFDTVSLIMNQGYSRIPIYDGDRSNVRFILYTKDLAFLDPDEKIPLKTVCQFYNNPCYSVSENTTLDILFREFKQGSRHMAMVHSHSSGDLASDLGPGIGQGKGSGQPLLSLPLGDDTKEDTQDEIKRTVGLVTMEDVIEALIQAEIRDEPGTIWAESSEAPLTNNLNLGRCRGRRSRTNVPATTPTEDVVVADSFGSISRAAAGGVGSRTPVGILVSPHLALAAFQYLSTSIEQFSSTRISKTILRRLLSQNLFFRIKIRKDPGYLIYERGKPADYFVLILEGRVQAEMGAESVMFESGAFTYFGTQSLEQNGVGVGEAPMTMTMGVPPPLKEERKSSNQQFGGSAPSFSRRNSNLDSFLLHSPFVPDYTVRPVTDITFLQISHSIYMAATQATLLERMRNVGEGENVYHENINTNTNVNVHVNPNKNTNITMSASDTTMERRQIEQQQLIEPGATATPAATASSTKRTNDMNDNLNYFRRVSLCKMGAVSLNNKIHGSEIFPEILLRQNPASDFDFGRGNNASVAVTGVKRRRPGIQRQRSLSIQFEPDTASCSSSSSSDSNSDKIMITARPAAELEPLTTKQQEQQQLVCET